MDVNNYAPRNPKWYVGRSYTWPDGEYLVAVTDGICDQGCDLMQPMNRLLEGYHDTAVQAVKAAMELWTNWSYAMPGVPICFGYDNAVSSMQNTDDFVATITAALDWAETADAALIRCGSCGEIIDANYYYDNDDVVYCSSRCLDRSQTMVDQPRGW